MNKERGGVYGGVAAKVVYRAGTTHMNQKACEKGYVNAAHTSMFTRLLDKYDLSMHNY